MPTSTIISDNGVLSGTTGLKTAGGDDGTLVLQTTTAGGTATTAITIDTSQAVTFAQTANLPNTFGFKNRIINGGMVIDQRNAGASITPTDGQYSVDRWQCFLTQASKYTVQQSTTAPTGFVNSVVVTSSSAYSVLTGDTFGIRQKIEGLNVSDLAWGTASAKSITISFWVRSSLTGTFGGAIQNSNQNRSYPFTYTISAANTYEQKTITVAGDTSGTWLTTNGIGISLVFNLGSGATYSGTAGAWAGALYFAPTGATSVVGTNAATWYVTGVQLEVGSTATSFDYRDYGRELAMCQRYYYKVFPAAANIPLGSGFSRTTTAQRTFIPFPITMRTAPSAVEQTGTASDYQVQYSDSATACSAVPAFQQATVNSSVLEFTVASGLTAGTGSFARTNSTSGYLAWSAEL